MPDEMSKEELLKSVNAAASAQKAKMQKRKEEEERQSKKTSVGGPIAAIVAVVAGIFTFGYIFYQSTHPPPPPVVKLHDLKENGNQLVGHISNTTKKTVAQTWTISYLDDRGTVVTSADLELKDVKPGEDREWTLELGSKYKPGLKRRVKSKGED